MFWVVLERYWTVDVQRRRPVREDVEGLPERRLAVLGSNGYTSGSVTSVLKTLLWVLLTLYSETVVPGRRQCQHAVPLGVFQC